MDRVTPRLAVLALVVLAGAAVQLWPRAVQARQQPAPVPTSGTQASDQPPQRPPIFRGGANLVRVDVTVSTRRGEPVTDLTRDDFEVAEDGYPQKIESFELVRATGEPTDDRSLSIRSPQHAANEASRDDVRLFLIFWDEYHIDQFIPSLRGREMLTSFVRSAFGPTDLVGLMDQLTTVDSIKFTRDWTSLADQVHKLKGRRGVLIPPRSPVEEAQLRVGRDIGRIRNEVTVSALKAAASFLGNFREGRKAILFVSQGVRMFGRSGESQLLADVVRTANTNNTAIYTLDPGAEIGRRPDSLMALAYDTGGKPFVGSNAPGLMLPQIVKDASVFYLLGYASNRNPADGRFHRIKVNVKKDGFDVRARSGYYAPANADIERARAVAAAAELPPAVENALAELSATERRDRVVDLWIGMARGGEGRTRLTIAWAPRTGPTPNNNQVPAAVTITALDGAGTTYFDGTSDGAHDITFDAPAGELTLKTTVRGKDGQEIDGETRRLRVPGFAATGVALGSPVVLRARNAVEARTLLATPDARPLVGREFDRSDLLYIRVPVYGEPTSGPTAVLLSRQAKELRTLDVSRLEGGLYQIRVPLTALPRGDYIVSIEATEGQESVKTLVPLRVR